MLADYLGENAFREGIRNYLNTYAYKNATVGQFLAVMEKAGGKELNTFKTEWLDSSGFPLKEALGKLRARCSSLRQFMALQQEMTTSAESNDSILTRYWEGSDAPEMREALIRTYFGPMSENLIGKAFRSGETKIRQALVLRTSAIPLSLKEDYESLLHDPSYVTLEAALYKLWIYFDGDRARYLDETRACYGLPNRNVRLLWLTLALLTPGYDKEHSQDFYRELCTYTSPAYSTETRQMAFEYLKEAFPFTDQCLKDLIKATVHPSWQFRSYARKLLDTLYQKEEYRERLIALAPELNEADLRYLRQKINTK
jgi:aminopeptidase N